ncbi:MAG: biotin/lipoyl-containing protein [Rhizomicrobium sp.]
MKMEHTLAAPGAATVEAVSVAVGDQVGEGTLVVRFAASA